MTTPAVPAQPGTVVLTFDPEYDVFDLYPVLAFVLDEDCHPYESVWVPDPDTGVPTTLHSACGYRALRRTLVLHPPVSLSEVVRFVDNTMWDRARNWFDTAVERGARYERKGAQVELAYAALLPKPADRWVAPPEADDAIERFNLYRQLGLAVRREDTSTFLRLYEAEPLEGGFGPELTTWLQQREEPPAAAVAS